MTRSVAKFLDLDVNSRHLKSHTDNKQCKCGRSFQHVDYLSEHLAICNDNYEFSNESSVFHSFVEVYHEQFIAIDQEEEANSDSLINLEITMNPMDENQHLTSQNPLKKHSPGLS